MRLGCFSSLDLWWVLGRAAVGETCFSLAFPNGFLAHLPNLALPQPICGSHVFFASF